MHFTLLQLTDLIESTLAQVFYGKTFVLLAETSEIKKSGNGHFYFDLIEKKRTIDSCKNERCNLEKALRV
jgi:exonuclease VII large subunit